MIVTATARHSPSLFSQSASTTTATLERERPGSRFGMRSGSGGGAAGGSAGPASGAAGSSAAATTAAAASSAAQGGSSYDAGNRGAGTSSSLGFRSRAGSRSQGTDNEAGSVSHSRRPSVTRENQPPSRMFVRALYNYATDDPTSLSFQQGDVIQVLKQLESGWWDGIVHGQRGWFPSNYCALIPPEEYANATGSSPLDDSDGMDDDSYDEEEYDDDDDSEHDGLASPGLPLEGTDEPNEQAAYWIPQATPDGRLYYFNTITGASRMELPLETPTSLNETGPRERSKVNVPDQTRPPPEMMARGYEHDYHGTDDESMSERDDATTLVGNSQHNSLLSKESDHRESQATIVGAPFDSVSRNGSIAQPATGMPTVHATAAATHHAKSAARKYIDDDTPAIQSWDELIEKTGIAVERYRKAINSWDRAQYVRRAEEISDMLRLLIAAGSATTDNHSGQPSIISSNKTLNPHFRHFMAAFSKLVLSSHVAATDCPPPDAEQKCLTEADEVMVGVFAFAETARAQRGEKLPRLKPGFVVDSHASGNWKGINSQSVADLARARVAEQCPIDDTQVQFTQEMVSMAEGLDSVVLPALKRLEATLLNNDPIVNDYQQSVIGQNVITTAQVAFDGLRRYFNLIDNVNVRAFASAVQNPTFIDFITQKQRLHDSFADLFMACQAVTAPLADEWTFVKGDPFEDRLAQVKVFIKDMEGGIRSLNLRLGFLLEELGRGGPEEVSPIERNDLRSERNGSVAEGAIRGHQRMPSGRMMTRASTTDGTSTGKATKLAKVLGPEVNMRQPEMPQEIPSYLQCDHDVEISYGKGGVVKGGTLVALVERLTRHDMLDSDFNSTFLLTYPSFTNANELFQHLARRFAIQPPPGLSPPEFEQWSDKKQKLIRVRVLSILKMWLESNWMESDSDKSRELLRAMYTFAKDIMLPQLQGTTTVMSLIETRLRGREPENKRLILTHSSQPPPPILPRNMRKLKFLDIDPLEFARQLTVIESRSYGKVKAVECLTKGWSRQHHGNSPDPAENIRAIIMQSNQLTNWVAEMILTQAEPRRRVSVIKHFISVAEKCRQLNNFSTLTAILAALQTASIHRLRRTWEHVPARINAVLEGMNQLMGATMNFAEYREILHLVNPPCVPFLGVYLKDLTFVADGNDDLLKGTELINFGKRVKTGNIIREIQQYQSVPYPLQEVKELQDYIVQNMQSARDVNEMYSLSLTLEPREREDEKIARLLQESGFL